MMPNGPGARDDPLAGSGLIFVALSESSSFQHVWARRHGTLPQGGGLRDLGRRQREEGTATSFTDSKALGWDRPVLWKIGPTASPRTRPFVLVITSWGAGSPRVHHAPSARPWTMLATIRDQQGQARPLRLASRSPEPENTTPAAVLRRKPFTR